MQRFRFISIVILVTVVLMIALIVPLSMVSGAGEGGAPPTTIAYPTPSPSPTTTAPPPTTTATPTTIPPTTTPPPPSTTTVPPTTIPVPARVNLKLLPQTSSVALGGSFKLDIQAEAGPLQVTGTDVFLCFDQAKLEVIDADDQAAGIQIIPGTTLDTVLYNTTDNAAGLISYSAGKLGSPFPAGAFTVASISFHVKATSPSNTSIFFTGKGVMTTKVVFGGNDVTGALSLASLFICDDAPLRLSPANSLAAAGEPMVILTSNGGIFDLNIETAVAVDQPVSGIAAYVLFDPSKLEVMDADPGLSGVQITPGSSLSSILINTVSNSLGLISYHAGQLGAPFPCGSFTVATIKFRTKAVAASATKVVISLGGQNTSSSVDYGGNRLPGIHGDADVSIVEGLLAYITFNLQGQSRPESGWAVPVTIKFFEHQATPVDVLTAGPDYIYSLNSVKGTSFAVATFYGIRPGVYDILIVSPHCLANVKRNVTISGSKVVIDMGTLLEGDANDDGGIRISDFGLLAMAYGKSAGQAGFDARADFDRDGQVRIADFGLLSVNYFKYAPIEIP